MTRDSWKDIPLETRRSNTENARKASREMFAARKLAVAINRINAAGGLRRATARVKAAGCQLEEMAS